MSFLISTPPQFEGLTANSRYEVIVQSKNRFGWSEPAKSFVFSTRLKGENFSKLSTETIGYSDSGGNCQKCHCSRLSLCHMIFTKRISIL